MENITLEQVEEEEKKRSKKENLIVIPYFVIGFVSMFVLNLGIEYIQKITFSTADSLFTISNFNYLYMVMNVILSFIFIPAGCFYLFRNFSNLNIKKLLKTILLIAIPCIPIIYLSFHSYLVVSPHSITHDPFWPGEKNIYFWEDIESVVIDRASRRAKRFDYYLIFKDGTSMDIWGDTRMNIEELKQVDDMIRTRGIPKYINERPNEKGLKKAYGDDPEKYKMVQQVISQ